jgi:two-component system chemotaxis response regulator CheB
VSAGGVPLAARVPGRDFDVLIIGGSAGGFSVLRAILPSLRCPPLVVIVVLHQASNGGDLAELFEGVAALPCVTVEDKLPAEPGAIYFAPSGYHLLIERNATFALSVDAPVNWSRPSIDVSFESAAQAYGARVMALILTGASDDGARGLAAIAAGGGTTLAQDPREAEVPLMPSAAIRQGAVREVLNPTQLKALFSAWSRSMEPQA